MLYEVEAELVICLVVESVVEVLQRHAESPKTYLRALVKVFQRQVRP